LTRSGHAGQKMIIAIPGLLGLLVCLAKGSEAAR
jgi:hypothetical protein